MRPAPKTAATPMVISGRLPAANTPRKVRMTPMKMSAATGALVAMLMGSGIRDS